MSRLSEGSGPSWSPSGAKIAFLAGGGVYEMQADGTDLRQLRARAKASDTVFETPVWTHDGRRLLVVAANYRAQYDLFVSNGDGSGLHRLTHTKRDEFLPAWSPDRRRIAFVRATEQRSDSIWVSSSSGRGARRLHSGTYPSWSSTGKRLAFESGGSVYTMSDRGSHTKLIGAGVMPAWSPDGKSIALMRDDALFVINVRTRHARKLADLSCGDPGGAGDTVLQQPEWSPASTTLAVTRLCDHGRWTEDNAWQIDAATGSQWDIDAGAGAPSRLAWSPDGRWIAFTTEQWDERIKASRIHGSESLSVSVSAGDDRDLDWR